MSKIIRIGTRDSDLALWQAKTVQSQLEHLGHQTVLVPVKSTGDLLLNQPIYELGITGVFTRTLDIALINEEIDIAVHSLKDVPTALPVGVVQAAVLKRGNIRDTLVFKTNEEFLAQKDAVIATGSLRRQAQWLNRYPTHTTVGIRGNVNTRLEKLEDSEWNGAIFAVEMETREDRFLKMVKLSYPTHELLPNFPIMEALRGVKESEEISLIKTACNITEKGFRRVLGFVKPGVMEYEIEAEYMHEFLRNRSKGFAYTPIIGSGYNACVLHYIENNQECKDGDLLLMDVAAEYANYSSDMTRTIPVNGRFTARQKAVYQAVLNVKNQATKLLVPGTMWDAYHVEVGKLMTSELLGLGLIDKADVQNEDPKWPAYKKYFMHGTSHHMGLDTHDFGALKSPMQANMVFTVEPGIYIPEENMGIRLEDDVVIQAKGSPVNLMQNIPIEIDEIEALMNSN